MRTILISLLLFLLLTTPTYAVELCAGAECDGIWYNFSRLFTSDWSAWNPFNWWKH